MEQLAGRASSHSDTAMQRHSKAGGSEVKAEPRAYSSNLLSTTTLKGPEALARLGVDVEQPPAAAETPSHAHRAFQWVSNLDRGAGRMRLGHRQQVHHRGWVASDRCRPQGTTARRGSGTSGRVWWRLAGALALRPAELAACPDPCDFSFAPWRACTACTLSSIASGPPLTSLHSMHAGRRETPASTSCITMS